MLSGAGLAEASLALAAISAYYDRAVHAGAIDANPCATVERPKPAADEQNQARALSRPQAAELLAAARTGRRCTSCSSACCSSTTCGSPKPPAPTSRTSTSTKATACCPSVAKAGPRRTTASPSTPPPSPRLAAGLNQRATIADAATGPLLLSPTAGRPLTRQAIYGLINRLARSAGVGQLTPTGSEPPWSRSQPQQGRSVEGEAQSGPRGPSDSWHADGLWRSSRRTLSTRRPNRRYRAQFLDSPQRGSRGLALELVAPSAMISARNLLRGQRVPGGEARAGGEGARAAGPRPPIDAAGTTSGDPWRPCRPRPVRSGAGRPAARAHTPARSRDRSAPAR